MARKVHILQGENDKILAVESSLKKLVESNTKSFNLLSYRQLHRLSKEAKDDNRSFITFNGKNGDLYKISWWEV